MDFLKAIYSFHGRMGRADFWVLALIFFVSAVLVIAMEAIKLPGRQFIGIFLVACSFLGWAYGAVRRLHDRDKSAWYLLLFIGVPSVLQNSFKGGNKGEVAVYFFSGGIGSAIDLICLGIGIWMIVELGFLRGTSGQNRYGLKPTSLFGD